MALYKWLKHKYTSQLRSYVKSECITSKMNGDSTTYSTMTGPVKMDQVGTQNVTTL